jgi:hypothetical protein
VWQWVLLQEQEPTAAAPHVAHAHTLPAKGVPNTKHKKKRKKRTPKA